MNAYDELRALRGNSLIEEAIDRVLDQLPIDKEHRRRARRDMRDTIRLALYADEVMPWLRPGWDDSLPTTERRLREGCAFCGSLTCHPLVSPAEHDHAIMLERDVGGYQIPTHQWERVTSRNICGDCADVAYLLTREAWRRRLRDEWHRELELLREVNREQGWVLVRRAEISEVGCQRCGHEGPDWHFQTHHRDRDRKNNTPENLERLCIPCHRAEHNGPPLETVERAA